MRRTLLTLIFFLLLIGNAVGASGDTEIWFGPLQHETSVKYDELLNNPSQWTNARNNVDVLLITQDISNLHSDAYSKLSGIKLALEVFITESTRSPDKTISCNSDIQADHVITLIRTIRSKGGDVKYVNMVEPLFEMQKSPKIADYIITLGMSGDKPIAGDWDNDGIDTIGVFRPTQGKFYLRNTNSQGNADITATFGTNGDIPIAGDWNNDGIDTIGVYRPSEKRFFLSNSNTQIGNAPSFVYSIAMTGDIPIAGDWNNDGIDTIGVYRPGTSTFFLRNSNSDGSADITPFAFGINGDMPIIGDWNNDGIDSVGLFRPIEGKFFLRNTNSQGNADITATFGTDGDLPIAGDWNNDGIDSVGVFRPTNGMFYLRNTNSAGPADASFAFGTKGDLPIAGDIDGSKKSGNHYVIISVKEKDVISNDDDVSKEPLPNRIWFGLNGNITSNWITEYQDDESGTDPEYYIIAEFGNLNNANKKDTRTSTMKVKACNRIKDGDCDGVKNEIDECPSSDECAVVNSNGCEEDTGEAKCQAFWDCSMVAWSDCNENNQQKRDLCKSGSGDCCGTWPLANCACSFTGDQENFNSCKDYFTPLTEKSCFTEEAFPAFTLSNFIITILLISGFYALRKKRY